MIRIDKVNGNYSMQDQVTWEEEQKGVMKEVFRDGKLLVDWTLNEIRACIQQH